MTWLSSARLELVLFGRVFGDLLACACVFFEKSQGLEVDVQASCLTQRQRRPRLKLFAASMSLALIYMVPFQQEVEVTSQDYPKP